MYVAPKLVAFVEDLSLMLHTNIVRIDRVVGLLFGPIR